MTRTSAFVSLICLFHARTISPHDMALEEEQATYLAKLTELLADEGKFVLVHGPSIVGIYTTSEEAMREGYERFKREPFLVRKIESRNTPVAPDWFDETLRRRRD